MEYTNRYRFLWFTVIMLGAFNLCSQENGFYYKYQFEDFLATKTTDKTHYLKTIYKNLIHPKLEGQEREDGIIRILILNHGINEIEVLAVDHPIRYLAEEAVRAIKIANKACLRKSKEKFLTELFVEFDVEPHRKRSTSTSYIKVISFKPRHK